MISDAIWDQPYSKYHIFYEIDFFLRSGPGMVCTIPMTEQPQNSWLWSALRIYIMLVKSVSFVSSIGRTKILPWPVHPFSVLTLTWFGDRKEILTCKKVHISSLQRGDIGTHLGPNLTWSYLWKNSPVKQKVSVVIPGPICLTQKIVHTASRCHIWKKYLNELSHLTFFVEIDRWGSVIFLFIDFVWCSVVHRVITDENRLMCTLFWTCRCTHMLHAHQVCGMMVVV